jgi:hypothetical protein
MNRFAENFSREVVSKSQIIFDGKAQADEKAQSRPRRDELFKEGCNAVIGHEMGF